MRFRFGDHELDDQAFSLTGPDGPVHVEPQVFDLLLHLMSNRDRVVPKEELLDTIWGDRFVSESALTSRVKAARRAVGDDGRAQQVIRTLHARGYQFVAPVRNDEDRRAARTDPGDDSGRPVRVRPHLWRLPIGRADDIARVIDRVQAGPLVTITGSGGMGKTTLALAVADRLEAGYADGVVFVDLAPVPPRSDVTRAVAEAAGLEGAASETFDRVAEHLAKRPLLLVLDNCEHVLVQVAGLVERMLDRAATAAVLATSREPLGLPGEQVWPLGPLHVEGPVLFTERARAAEPRIDWDPEDPAVVAICGRLDNVPLALELAAGQLRRFDLDELCRRLEDRLALLAGRAAGESLRHATMEAAIDWSYQLLDPSEQCLLRHLGVFPSGFDLAAVEATSPPLGDADPVAVFGRLVDKSLVVRHPGSRRYRLLETLRMFALDRLAESAETTAAFERHRRHVRDRIASASRLDRWLSASLAASYRADLDDTRQSFRRSMESGELADAVEIAIGAAFLWRQAIGCTEGVRWIDELLACDLSPRDELWVHILGSDVGQGRGDPQQMFGITAAADRLIGRVDDPGAVCIAAHYDALAHLTEPVEAESHLTAVLALARLSGDRRLVTLMETYGAVADLVAGNRDASRTVVGALHMRASDDGYDRFILHWTGWMLGLAERDAVTARQWMSRQQEFLDRTGIVETWLTTFSTAMCDAVEGGAVLDGDPADHGEGLGDVRAMLAHTLDLADREGYQADADCVLVLAYAELGAGHHVSAAELVGTAMHSRFNATAHHVLYRTVLEPALRQRLDPAALESAMARGRTRTATDALVEHGIAHA